MAAKKPTKRKRTMKAKPVATVKAWKGFDANMQCRGVQYAVGATVTHDGPVTLCRSGIHVCLHPLDVLSYYHPADNCRFAEVECIGLDDSQQDGDSKRVCRSVTVAREVTLADMIVASLAAFATGEHCQVASGNSSTAASSGNFSKAASSGNSSTAASSGNFSKAACGTNGFASVAGVGGCVKGDTGSALSLGYRDAAGRNRIAIGYVGEDGIKPNTFYRVESGKLVEAK